MYCTYASELLLRVGDAPVLYVAPAALQERCLSDSLWLPSIWDSNRYDFVSRSKLKVNANAILNPEISAFDFPLIPFSAVDHLFLPSPHLQDFMPHSNTL